ncbi:Uncharacterised protein [Bacillus licheniformis]|nr:Uncharacterised protein [Bacillus licheniformis]
MGAFDFFCGHSGLFELFHVHSTSGRSGGGAVSFFVGAVSRLALLLLFGLLLRQELRALFGIAGTVQACGVCGGCCDRMFHCSGFLLRPRHRGDVKASGYPALFDKHHFLMLPPVFKTEVGTEADYDDQQLFFFYLFTARFYPDFRVGHLNRP